jgi:hypothetical protein
MFGRTGRSGNDGLGRRRSRSREEEGFFPNTVKLSDNDDKREVMRMVVSNHWQESFVQARMCRV